MRWILALALAWRVGVAVPDAGAAVSARTGLERRLTSGLSDQRFGEVPWLADSIATLDARAGRSPGRIAAWLDSLGLQCFNAGTDSAWIAAEHLFRSALRRRERALGTDHVDVARSLVMLATLYDYQGRWPEAEPLAERAVRIRERERGERHEETASGLRLLGVIRFQSGDYAGAGEPLRRSVAIYMDLGPGHEARVADGFNNLGELARVENQIDEAEAHFRRGLSVAEALPVDDPVRVALTNNLAGLYKDLGRYDEAEPLLEGGLAVVTNASDPDPAAIAIARLNLAEVYRLQDRPETAAPLYAGALEQARLALGPDHPDLGTFFNQAAVNAQWLGRFAEAESLFVEAGGLVERLLGPEHPLVAQNQNDLAGLWLATGRWQEAETAYRRVLAMREQSYGPSHPEVAMTLVELARARAFDSSDPDGPAPLLARAIAILDSNRVQPEARLDAYAQLAEWHARHGRYPTALANMAHVLDLADSLRAWRGGGNETRAAFLARRQELYDHMLAWQLEIGQVAPALETHERGRARVLLDQLATSRVDLRAGIAPELLAPLAAAERAAEVRLAATRQQLAWARTDASGSAREWLERVAQLEREEDERLADLERVRSRIQDASPLWRRVLSTGGRIASTAELQRDLVPRDGLMLVYHVGFRASHVFRVEPTGRVQARELVVGNQEAAVLGVTPGPLGAATLEQIVMGGPKGVLGMADLLRGVEEDGLLFLPHREPTRGADSLSLRLSALHRTLVPSAWWPTVRKLKTALIVPDGALHMIPFEVLVTNAGRGAKRRYWLDDGPALAYGASATSLLETSRRGASTASGGAPVLSVTDVDFTGSRAVGPRSGAGSPAGGSWRALPGTARETEAIQKAFGNGVTVLRGEDARETSVRGALANRRYLHLATHGYVQEGRSHLLAGLVLARPDSITSAEDDGLLELHEIYRLRLDCQLAVLSACESHRGRRVAGEGAFALSRGFLAAGARSVVASQWAVADEPTAVVVGSMFAQLAAGRSGDAPVPLEIALRDGKRRIKTDPRWADPFYWAPLVLTGR